MELSELFTQSAREVLPLARKKGLVSYFDYEGPYLLLDGDAAGLKGAIHRILLGLTECLEAGFLIFTAEVRLSSDGTAAVAVHAAGTGTTADQATVAQVLQRLMLVPTTDSADRGSVMNAAGVCPVVGAQVEFLDAGLEGLVFSLRTSLRGTVVPGADPLPDAAGVSAWLVSAVPGGLLSVDRRLRRLGWHVRLFDCLQDALALLHTRQAGGQHLPQLLVAVESSGGELAELERANIAIPPLWTVLAVLAGSSALEARGGTEVDIRPLPLSPMELQHITAHIDPRTSTADSRQTSPVPLYLHDRRLVLVVDDNFVNQIVARGQLELLGYEVAIASNGAEALAHCSSAPPDLVLMDLDMPVMGGLEATKQLRDWQQVGRVPPFPIVAATTRDNETLNECIEAGMDGYLRKPLNVQQLADEIHRVLPERTGFRGLGGGSES